ncbi:hypothetical protein EBT11_09555 [bacterium]|nr:hypothetical protein [bacterium]
MAGREGEWVRVLLAELELAPAFGPVRVQELGRVGKQDFGFWILDLESRMRVELDCFEPARGWGRGVLARAGGIPGRSFRRAGGVWFYGTAPSGGRGEEGGLRGYRRR